MGKKCNIKEEKNKHILHWHFSKLKKDKKKKKKPKKKNTFCIAFFHISTETFFFLISFCLMLMNQFTKQVDYHYFNIFIILSKLIGKKIFQPTAVWSVKMFIQRLWIPICTVRQQQWIIGEPPIISSFVNNLSWTVFSCNFGCNYSLTEAQFLSCKWPLDHSWCRIQSFLKDAHMGVRQLYNNC